MSRLLRADLEMIDLGTSGSVLVDPVSRARFRLSDEACHLMRWLDEGQGPKVIRQRYREQFGLELPRRYIREFVRQVQESGLVESAAPLDKKQVDAIRPSDLAPVPAPLTAADPAARLNHRFDLLVLLFGWLLHPVWLIPLVGLCAVAVVGFVHNLDRFLAELVKLLGYWERTPFLFIGLILLCRLLFLSLVRELTVGMAWRRFGGRLYSLRFLFVYKVIPAFSCAVDDSVARLRGRGRWTLLTIRLWSTLAIGSGAMVGWLIAAHGSVVSTFCLLLILPTTISAFLHFNIFMPLDGYAVLSTVARVPNLLERATAHTAAWLTLRCAPEPLTDRERFWFRAYGLGVYTWRLLVFTVVIGGVGWLFTTRFGRIGALAWALLLILWFKDPIRRRMMAYDAFRWAVRTGGRWWIRWPVRLILLGGIIACGLLPYQYEVSGECRLVPAAERGVRSEIPGTIEKVNVAEGDWVEQGAVMAALVARQEQADVAMTRAQLARVKAELALLRAGARVEEIAMAAEQLKLRQIELQLAETELARLLRLSKTGAANELELARAHEERDSTEQMVRISKEYLQRVEKGAREEEIQAAEAEVQRLQAQLAHHERMFSLREIKAPISGRVVTLNIQQHLGQYVQPGDLIAVIHDTSHLRVQMSAPDAGALHIRPGANAKVRFWALDGRLLSGRVEGVSSYVLDYTELSVERIRSDREIQLKEAVEREQDRYLRVCIRLDNGHQPLVPGMTGYARVAVGQDRLWRAVVRPVLRFARVEVWSWLP